MLTATVEEIVVMHEVVPEEIVDLPSPKKTRSRAGLAGIGAMLALGLVRVAAGLLSATKIGKRIGGRRKSRRWFGR
jgi:hypothetical protein